MTVLQKYYFDQSCLRDRVSSQTDLSAFNNVTAFLAPGVVRMTLRSVFSHAIDVWIFK